MKQKKPTLFCKIRFNQPPPPIKITSYSSLVGGFNPSEKHSSKWVHLPQFSGRKYKIFETTTQFFGKFQTN